MLSLRRVAAVAVQAPKRAAFVGPMQVATMTDLHDKEKAAERVYFNKEDEKSLRRLLQKLKGQADVNDAAGLKDHLEHDKKGLSKIAGLDLSEEQVKALLEWKHKH